MNVKTILAGKGSEVFTLSPGGSILAAAKSLSEHKVGALVVADEAMRILGILSERDIVRAVAELGSATLEKTVDDLMTRNVTTCSEESTVSDLMALMTEGRFRHLPVEKDGKLIGIVSIGDVVKRRIAEVEDEAAHIKSYISSY